MELGIRIKELRNVQGINQDELANKLFVSRQTVSNWENGKSYPDIQSVLLLSEIFDVSVDNLLKGDIEKMERYTIVPELSDRCRMLPNTGSTCRRNYCRCL